MDPFFVSDSHNDILTFIVEDKKNSFNANIFLEKSGCEKLTQDVKKFCPEEILKSVGLAVFTTDKNFSTKDLENYKRLFNEIDNDSSIEYLFCVEDLGFIKNFFDIENLVNIKPFSCTLTWNYDNNLAGGANGVRSISNFGKFVVKHLESNNIQIDTAHLNRKSFDTFVLLTTRPIFNSHSNIYSLFKHKRNLLDWQIKKIVETNGYFGITLYNRFIQNDLITSENVAEQFVYLVEKFGFKNFGFGTDFFGVEDKFLPKDISKYEHLSNVAERLLRLGFTDDQLKSLMYRNFVDFVGRVRKINNE